MIRFCAGCGKKIHFRNDAWHKKCRIAWDDGYQRAKRFAETENEIKDYPSPWDMYAERMQPSTGRLNYG
jgi:NADH pyrophosphatase NudC (nudix superfamily)